MNDTLIVTVFVVIDDVMRACGHRSHPQARTSDAEVLTVAVMAAWRRRVNWCQEETVG